MSWPRGHAPPEAAARSTWCAPGNKGDRVAAWEGRGYDWGWCLDELVTAPGSGCRSCLRNGTLLSLCGMYVGHGHVRMLIYVEVHAVPSTRPQVS